MPTLACADEPISVYVGQGQMPFAGGGEASRDGVFEELMQGLCRRAELDCHYRSMPWRRALAEAAQDPHAVVLNLGRTPERESQFLWLLHVLPTHYVLASRERNFASLDEALDAGPVVVMGGTPRAKQLLDRPGAANVIQVNDPEQAVRMLRGGRAVAWYEIDLRVGYLWHQVAESPDERLWIGRSLDQSSSYIAANPNLAGAADVQARLQQAFDQMNADGSWQRILEGYFDAPTAGRILSADKVPQGPYLFSRFARHHAS